MTDLESDIDTLRELDTLRVESEQLRKEGTEVLTTILTKGYTCNDCDLFELARVSMTLWEQESDPPQQLNEWKKKLENLKLTDINDYPLPILLAAQILQALAAAPGFAFSKSFLYSYYLIVRELYTADAPDWAVGGARAKSKDGMVSAYVTRECVRAIRSFARVLERLSNFITKVGAIHKRRDLLQTSFPELEKWVLMEEARLKFALHTTIRIFSRHLVFQSLKLPDKPKDIDITTVIGAIASQLKDTAQNAHAHFTNALNDIKEVRKKEATARSKTDEKEHSRFIRSEPGHRAAISALERGLAATDKLIKLFNSSGPSDEFKNWEQLKEGVKDPTTKIYELLRPATNFLSSVLNRELAEATGGSYGGWDVVEMACSGAAHGAVANEWGDERLHRVADCLQKVVSDHGQFPIGRPFHADAGGTYAVPPNTAVMAALAQILKNTAIRAQRLKRSVAIPVEQKFVRKILYFFKETRADKPPKGTKKGETAKYGWSSDYATPPRPTEPGATAQAVQLLGLINKMLNEQLNAQILFHFFVRRPEQLELESGPDLGTLFYPDYGLSLAPLKISRKDSIAISLQRMRAHVCGLQDVDRLYSLVLHGPQGTGKTTIVEALALSCGVPLVEVTPSDIVVRGQEAVERRARAVFEALSLLTRVVILFDEFDPVLWRRDPKDRPKDVFAFLIPGMLPKLRMLYKTAERRSAAYVLITNLIGSLDEATIREGALTRRLAFTHRTYCPDLGVCGAWLLLL